MKKLLAFALTLMLLALCAGCALESDYDGLATFAYNGVTYYYRVFFDEEQATEDSRMATARIEAVAAKGEAPHAVKAEMIEDLFDGSGLTLTVEGTPYAVTSLITKFNKDGTFAILDFGAAVPLDTADSAAILLEKNPAPAEGN